MASVTHKVQRMNIERLRLSAPAMVQVLVQDVIRQHVERIEPATLADLFALVDANLPGALGKDLAGWAARARREIADLPDGATRATFVSEVGELPPADVPGSLREAVLAMAEKSSPETAARVEECRARWADVEPAAVSLPTSASAKIAAAQATKTTTKAPARAPRTPAAQVDPRRAEWIRGDVLARLGAREYLERGLKETILVAGVQHRSPYKDLTVDEVRAELRRLERERKVKHTADRWLIR
ncbi:MAG: hypothetical protein ACOZNI_32515 [Myxococcota bacterium]